MEIDIHKKYPNFYKSHLNILIFKLGAKDRYEDAFPWCKAILSNSKPDIIEKNVKRRLV